MTASARFREVYAQHRAAEGRGSGGREELLSLPFLRSGPWARQWGVRARTYRQFVSRLVTPRGRTLGRPLSILDLGAGNGWLSFRLAELGHDTFALDVRSDSVDGLGAAAGYNEAVDPMFPRIAASFDAIPLSGRFDLVVFNASIHYSTNLRSTVAEAARLTAPGGSVVILDSPFYRSDESGETMVAEKRSAMLRDHSERAVDLLAHPAIEYLTPRGLRDASASQRLAWRRHRVRYPLWYELRGVLARLRRRREPSRFDIWEGVTPP